MSCSIADIFNSNLSNSSNYKISFCANGHVDVILNEQLMAHIMILQRIVSFDWPSLEQFVVSLIVLAKSFNALYCYGKSTTGSVVCEFTL